MRIGHVTLLVKDLDEAAKFYVEKIGFEKRQDTTFWETCDGSPFPRRISLNYS